MSLSSLVATAIADEADFSEFADVVPVMVHGGTYPATFDARGTSVGTLVIDRYLRPVCYQNYPQGLLPEALKDENPFNILRLVNGEMNRNKI